MTDPELPEPNLNIEITEIKAKSRKLSTSWSQAAADDLRGLWGMKVDRRTPLKKLVDLLDDPEFDPDDPEAMEKASKRWEEKNNPGLKEERELIENCANEMRDEIDREILETMEVEKHERKLKAAIRSAINNALDKAARGEFTPDLHDQIITALREERVDKFEGSFHARPKQAQGT